MKVRDIMNKLESEEKVFHCLERMEEILRQDSELCKIFNIKCKLSLSAVDVISQAKMHYFDSYHTLRSRLMDMDVPDNII